MPDSAILVDFANKHPSTFILSVLGGLALAAGLLFVSGAIGLIIHGLGGVFSVCIRVGFYLWKRLLAWASWPIFLAMEFACLAMGVPAAEQIPALAILFGAIPLLMGMLATLAYIFIDWERFALGRGYKTTHNPVKGQTLAEDLIRHGHRVGVPLLAAAAVGVLGGFALLNQGLEGSVGRDWYKLGQLRGNFYDFVAYAVIHLYGIVDILDLVSHSKIVRVAHVEPAAWPARALLNTYKIFVTFVLVQQVIASVRRGKLLGETIDDFWSPHEPIHQRATKALPLYGLAAIHPLLRSLRSQPALTQEQREQLPVFLADLGPALVPLLTKYLRDPHDHVRAVAVATLGRLNAQASLAEILRLANDPSEAVRHSTVNALGTLGAPVAIAEKPTSQITGAANFSTTRHWLRIWWWKTRHPVPVDALPALLAALRDKLSDTSPKIRVQAAQALAKIGACAVDAATNLRKLITDRDETVRCEAAEALGAVGASDTATQATLTELLHAGSAAVRQAAARALGRVKQAAAVPALVAALHDPDDAVRQTVADAISAIGVVSNADRNTLLAGLKSPDSLVRAQTARALGTIGIVVADAAPALVEAMRDDNDSVRAEVVEALGKMGPEAAEVARPRMVHALRDPDSWVSALAAEMLGDMGEAAEDAVPALVKSLGHVSAPVRANAAEALGKLGEPGQPARRALCKAAADPEGAVRAQAIHALGALGADAATRALVRAALADADPLVRAAAAETAALEIDFDQTLRADLIRLLDDPNDDVKIKAAQGLARHGGAAPDVIEPLCRRLVHDDSIKVQGQAALALGKFGPEAAAAGPALSSAALTAEASVRKKALQALASIQPPQAVHAFLAGLKDANADIRRIAATGLRRAAQIPDEAIEALVDALTDPEVSVRSHAAYALSRLEQVPAQAAARLCACAAHESAGLRMVAALALQTIPAKSAQESLAGLLDDPNMSIRLVAAQALLPTSTRRQAAVLVVTEALHSPAASHRRAALRAIEMLDDHARDFEVVLRLQAAQESEEELSEMITLLLRRCDAMQAKHANLPHAGNQPRVIPAATGSMSRGEKTSCAAM